MPLSETITPPPVVDVQLEILRLRDGTWREIISDSPFLIEESAAVRCLNRGDRAVFGALFMRDMSGTLRATQTDFRELPPDEHVELGTNATVTLTQGDVELVVAVAADPSTLLALSAAPWEERDTSSEARTLLGIPIEVQLCEVAPSDEDLRRLLEMADRELTHKNKMALQALTLLPLPEATIEAVEHIIRSGLRLVNHMDRSFLLEVAANLPSDPTRDHLRSIASDDTDPHQEIALRSLAEIGDDDAQVIDNLQKMLHGRPQERVFAARNLASQKSIPIDFHAEVSEEDKAAFWIALGAARDGNLQGLTKLLTNVDNVAFHRIERDPINSYSAVRDMRPLPESMQIHLSQLLRNNQLASAVEDFFKRLIKSTKNERALTDGIRHVPHILAEKIRWDLQQVPGLVDLQSFESADGRGWTAMEAMNRAQRGVLLSELLQKCIKLPHKGIALDSVTNLVARWSRYPWYPDLKGLMSASRKTLDSESAWGNREISNQIGWAASRAPIPPLLRLVNERIHRGNLTTPDLDLLVSAIATHWDEDPPPRGVLIQRLPRPIRDKIAIERAEAAPSVRQARAWSSLEIDASGSMPVWFSLGSPAYRRPDPVAAKGPEEQSSHQLIVTLIADGAEVSPKAARKWLPSDGPLEPVEFRLSPSAERISLRFLIYSAESSVLLQELLGFMDLRGDSDET